MKLWKKLLVACVLFTTQVFGAETLLWEHDFHNYPYNKFNTDDFNWETNGIGMYTTGKPWWGTAATYKCPSNLENTRITWDFHFMKFDPQGECQVMFYRYNGNSSLVSSVAFNKEGQGSMVYYKTYANFADELVPVITTNIPFQMNTGRVYQVVLIRGDCSYHKMELIDKETGESCVMEAHNPKDNVGMGTYNISIAPWAGRMNVLHASYSSLQPPNPRLEILGHSLTEGNSILSSLPLRWANKVSKRLAGSCIISAMGGETTLIARFTLQTDIQPFHPSYTLIALDVNDYNFNEYTNNMEMLIQEVKNTGSKPILCTATPRFDRVEFLYKARAYVRNRGLPYVDFSKAVSPYDDEDAWLPGYVMPDQVHPTVDGHEAMYRQCLIDIPFVFQDPVPVQLSIKVVGTNVHLIWPDNGQIVTIEKRFDPMGIERPVYIDVSGGELITPIGTRPAFFRLK